MSIKRVASIGQKGAKSCLTCGWELENLQDDVVNTCGHCGQQHYVDLIGTRLALTIVERADCRRRLKESIVKEEQQALKIARLEKMLEAAKIFSNERGEQLEHANERIAQLEQALLEEKKNAKEWEQAAEGLEKKLEELKEQGAW